MHPDTRPYLYLVGSPEMRDELTEEHIERLRDDRASAARIAQTWCDHADLAEEARAGRRASRAVVAVRFAAFLVAGFLLGYGVVRFGAFVGAKVEATVAMGDGGW